MRAEPHCPCKAPCPQKRPDTGHFLLQRIHGSGILHRRSFRYTLSLENLSCHCHETVNLVAVCTNGNPVFQMQPGCDGYVIRYLVRIPLLLTFCTASGEKFTISSCIEEVLPIRLQCPMSETWRYQPLINAAVRMACNCQSCSGCTCCPLLEVYLEGYLVSPCQMAGACPLPCPESKPWYPSPGCC